MSLLVLIVTALQNRGYLKVVTAEHYHIMGKFMLAFTHLLGLHRLQPIHAHLVCQHPGGNQSTSSSAIPGAGGF